MIRIDGVGHAFGGVTVLDCVDLTVERGELVGLVGPNGVGKTTLLRMVNGILTPDSGAVTLDGGRVDELSSKATSRLVATVPQDTHVGFAFTAEQIVQMGRTPHRSRLDWSDDTEPVEAALDRTRTVEFRDRRVDELSGGERQRVLLARALAQDTPALVLDEPTANLDINHQIRVLEIVEELIAEGRAGLAAIHDLNLAARYCDRLCLLGDGAVRTVGPPSDVLDDAELDDAFATTTAVTQNHVTGTPVVTAVGKRPNRNQHVHVVGGGAVAAAALGTLWTAGFRISAGPVTQGDVVAETADRLDVDCLRSGPFELPDGRTLETARDTVKRADAVVATGDLERRLISEVIDSHDAVVTIGAGGQAATAPGDVVPAILDTSRPDDTDGQADGIVPTVVETLENPPTSADD
ncbi:MAG: ATP-binding cassette domain-containing protein [Haloarculaceae archaeon]